MNSTPQPYRLHSRLLSLLVSLVLVTVEAFTPKPSVIFSSPFALHTSGSHLLNATNQPVCLKWTWWGANLLGVPANPVRLTLSDHLVYSVHDFPATVFPQAWFSEPTYPANLP